MSVRPSSAERLRADSELNQIQRGDDQLPTMREFEVTVLTTRSGTTVVLVEAFDHQAAINAVREELASGDFSAPPEQCTNDVQTEIWTVREAPSSMAVPS